MFRNIILAFGLLIPGVAHADWHVASSRHFVVYADDTPEHIRAFTDRLERFDSAVRVWHQAPEDKHGATARVTVFMVSDIDAIRKLTGSNEIAGFYNPRAAESVAFTPRSSGSNAADVGFTAQAILFHEYTHHWMLTTWADAAFPPWFVEGFAELHATALIRPDGSVTFGANPTYRKYTVGNYSLLPSERLLRPDPGHLSGAERDALYSRGWLLSHYLTFDPERRKALAAYVGAINAGKTIAEAGASLGDVSGLDFKLNTYGKRSVLPSETIPASLLSTGEVNIRKLSPAEAAIMPAFILSKRGVTPTTAPKVAELARQLAAPYPNDPFVLNELAEAEYDAKNFAASEAAAARAMEADPKSIHALLYRGMAEEAAAKKDKVTDPARWADIRHWFLTANKIDTEDPRPLIEFYNSYRAAGQKPTKNAETALIYAYALAPYDGGLRTTAGYVFLQQGKVALARTALGPVAYNLDSPTTAAFALKVLAAIDSGGAPAGLAVYEEAFKKAEEPPKDGKDAKGS